jgi:hypothetical protein
MTTTNLNVSPNCDLLSFSSAMSATETPLRFQKTDWQVLNATSVTNGYAQGFTFQKVPTSEAHNYPTSYLSIPYVISGTQQVVGAATSTATLGNPYFVGFKAPGSLSIIDKVTLKLAGANVSSASNRLAQYQYLKYVSSVSENWHRMNGPALFMGSELPEKEILSMRSTSSTVDNGIDCWANITVTPAQTFVDGVVPPDGPASNLGNVYNANRAFMSRCFNISRPGRRNMAVASNDADLDKPKNQRSPFILPTKLDDSTVLTDASVYLSGYAIIPLVFVHDIFRELKIARNVSFTMTILVNSGYGVLPAGGTSVSNPPAGTAMASQANASFADADRSFPLMISTAGCTAGATAQVGGIRNSGNVGALGIVYGCHSLSVGGGITPVNDTRQVLNSQSLVPCELWLQMVDLTDEQVKLQLANPPKKLLFSDFENGNITNNIFNAGQKFSLNLGAPTSAKRVWVTLTTPSSLTRNNCPVWQQCLSSEGFVSSPNTSLRDIQVKVDGVPIYLQPIEYDHLHYDESIRKNLSGASCAQMVSYAQGIYSKQAWDVCPIYAFNLDGFVRAGTAPQIVLEATNSSPTAVQVNSYIETLNEVSVSVTPSQFVITSAVESR